MIRKLVTVVQLLTTVSRLYTRSKTLQMFQHPREAPKQFSDAVACSELLLLQTITYLTVTSDFVLDVPMDARRSYIYIACDGHRHRITINLGSWLLLSMPFRSRRLPTVAESAAIVVTPAPSAMR
jgi:hypothetical protein